MSAAFFSIDIVDVAKNIFLVAVIVLQGNFDNGIFTASVKVNRRGIKFSFFTVEVFDERFYSALKVKNIFFTFSAFISQRNFNSTVEKSQFAQTIFQSVIVKISHGKNFFVWYEVNNSTSTFSRTNFM